MIMKVWNVLEPDPMRDVVMYGRSHLARDSRYRLGFCSGLKQMSGQF